MVKCIREVELALGSSSKIITNVEKKVFKVHELLFDI